MSSKNEHRLNNNISATEFIVFMLIVIILITGIILSFYDIASFGQYTREDGEIEWLTVVALLLVSYTCFNRALSLRKNRHWTFLLVSLLLGIIFFFGAGEEISWGQRILGIESPDYFKEKNTQGETNFHNLVLGGIKVNMWIFSFLLTAVLAIYILLIPFLYRRKKWMQNLVRNWGIPLPKWLHIAFFVLAFAVTEAMPHGKRAELLEVSTALLLFLIIRFPANPQTFERELHEFNVN